MVCDEHARMLGWVFASRGEWRLALKSHPRRSSSHWPHGWPSELGEVSEASRRFMLMGAPLEDFDTEIHVACPRGHDGVFLRAELEDAAKQFQGGKPRTIRARSLIAMAVTDNPR